MKFEKVSVLVPTRGRVARLRTMIASFDQTTGNDPDAELVFRIDDDDLEVLDFLRAWGGHTVVVGPRMRGYGSMPDFFNELVGFATGSVLICGNDDMVFKTSGWPALILAKANEFPNGLFDIGVRTHNEEHFPFSITSKIVAEHLGFLWDPRIFWGDIFLRDVMSAFGRAVMLSEVEIEHDWAGFHPDKTFIESDKGIPADYWNVTHPTAVTEAVNKLKASIHTGAAA